MEKKYTYFNNLKENNPHLPERIGVYWTDEEEAQLLQHIQEDKSYEEISMILQRTSGSIKARLKHIANQMIDKEIDVEQIKIVTKLSQEDIDEVIKLNNINKIKKEKKKEEKILQKEPVKATLLTIPASDIMELKLVMFEIRDLLRVIANK